MNLLRQSKSAQQRMADAVGFRNREWLHDVFFGRPRHFDEWLERELDVARRQNPGVEKSMGKEEFRRAAMKVVMRISNLKRDMRHKCGALVSLVVSRDPEVRQCLGCCAVTPSDDKEEWGV